MSLPDPSWFSGNANPKPVMKILYMLESIQPRTVHFYNVKRKGQAFGHLNACPKENLTVPTPPPEPPPWI